MPTNRLILPPLLLVAALLGCDSNAVVAPKTPHNGTILPIPGEKGFVEVVRKPVDGQAGQAQYVLYFYGPDSKPMATPPTVASLKPEGKGAKPLEFKPTGDADSTFASDPFPEDRETDGELSMTVDGKTIKIVIRAR